MRGPLRWFHAQPRGGWLDLILLAALAASLILIIRVVL